MKYKNAELRRGDIKFRSKLEAYCYDVMTDARIKFSYETLIIPLLDSFEYEPECGERVGKKYKIQRQRVNKMTYKPDFIGDSNLGIVETKGYFTPVARLKGKLFKKGLINNNLHCKLFMPTNKGEVLKTVELIQEIDDRLKIGAHSKKNKRIFQNSTSI